MEENPNEKFITINLKDFKNHFYQVLIPLLSVIAICFIIVRFTSINLSVLFIRRYALPIMAVLAVTAFVHSAYQQKKLKMLRSLENFEQKAETYKKVYRLRLNWYMISGFTCCFVYLFSAENLFLFFAIFDALLLFQNFPNKRTFQRDLQAEDIIFY
jgi:hypothetical protein